MPAFDMKKIYIAICLLGLLNLALSGCAGVDLAHSEDARINNVILVIGDGMGPQQVGLLLSYARQAPSSVIESRKTAFDRMIEQGDAKLTISTTHAAGTLVTDSAASASQLATGYFAGSEMLGLDKDGNRRETIVEKAKRIGKATGLVSDTRITHATPAAFAAHQTHRSLENEIAEDLLAIGPDVMFSAGWSYWLPETVNDKQSQDYRSAAQLLGRTDSIASKRNDRKNLLAQARQQGYELVFNKSQLQQARDKTLGLFAASELPNGIAETLAKQDPARTVPTLKEMSRQALDILSKNEQGFFLMIEAGQIDWASHGNDTGTLLHEMLRMNETLEAVLDWMQGRDDTLLIVTADHETGGFGFSYSAADLPEPRSLPGAYFQEGRQFQPSFNYGNPEVLDRLYAQQLSYFELFKRFESLPKAQQKPARLVEMVNLYTEFKIDERQAERILATEKNRYYRPNHKSLSLKRVPMMGFNSAFFAYPAGNRQNLLAREVAEQQHAVWATGTHTSTPVYVFMQGPRQVLQPFEKILHHTEIGRLAADALQ